MIAFCENYMYIWNTIKGNNIAGPISCSEHEIYDDILIIFSGQTICIYNINTGELIAACDLKINSYKMIFLHLYTIINNTFILVLDNYINVFDVKTLQLLHEFSINQYI